MKKHVLSSCLIMAFLFISSVCFSASTSSCVNCHTNDAVMKSLYKPPAIGEGEGEG